MIPNGQFKLRLSFGFYEAPAELKKCLVIILQSFRDSKIIVYIANILI